MFTKILSGRIENGQQQTVKPDWADLERWPAQSGL
jgi:hypothetical protein